MKTTYVKVPQKKIDLMLSSFNNQQYQQARKQAKELIRLDQYNADALNVLCRISLTENRLQDAEKFISLALKHNAVTSQLKSTRAVVYMYQRDFFQAIPLFEELLNDNPEMHLQRQCLADCLLESGQYAKAAPHFAQLVMQEVPLKFIHANLFQCLQYTTPRQYSPQQESQCLRYLSFGENELVDLSDIAGYVSKLIALKYALETGENTLDLKDIASDPLLNKALTKIILTNEYVEVFLTGVRRALLVELTNQQEIPNSYLELAVNLGLQQMANEYLYIPQTDETEIVEHLSQLLTEAFCIESPRLDELGGSVMVIAMYHPLYQLKCASKMAVTPLDQWPEVVRPLVRKGLLEIDSELSIAAKLPNLTEIDDQTSLAVKQQYEDNPYPRWTSISYRKTSGYATMMEQNLYDYQAPDILKQGSLDMLIAGCGTGKHAIELAKSCPEAKVTAVDLSKRSLAYAQQKAQHYQLDNLTFGSADILKLDQLKQRFHVIECGGVLHHMHDPEAGWRVLSRLLEPGGVMKIALYSELARKAVVEARETIQAQGFNTDLEGIRAFRLAAMSGELGEPIRAMACHSPDFFSISGCRDLFFHVQEHRYTCELLAETLDHLNLNFLGFSYLSPNTAKNYRSAFPEDPAMTSLTHWAEYEKSHPQTFTRMYQFWCQLQ